MKNLIQFWFLRNFDLTKKLSRTKLLELSEILEMTSIDKGEILPFSQENSQVVYFLKSGTIKVTSAKNGVTKYLVKEGNLFGELALLDDSPDNDLAIALEESVICFIEKNQMKAILAETSELKNELLKSNGAKIRRLERRLSELLYKDSKTRIQEYLFDYIHEFGEKSANGNWVAKNIISHSDIAALTNTARQTVSNVMSQLRKDQIIHYDSKIIEIM